MEGNKMKIICFGTRHMTGGASRNAVLIAEELLRNGHQCELWFLWHTSEMETNGITTRVFFDKKPSSVKELVQLVWTYFRAIRQAKPDTVISFYPLTNILGSLSRLCGGPKRFIATQQNPLHKQSPFILWSEKLCGSSSLYDMNIAVSKYVADSCRNYPSSYIRKMRVIYNGVPNLPKISGDKKTSRGRFCLPDDTFIIGSLGRLDSQKNVAILLRTMAQNYEMHLAVAGTGHLESELKQLSIDLGIIDRVTFLGNLVGDEISHFYRAIDVFAFATHYEGFGLTLVEAFSSGVPVVASDLEVLREIGDDAALYVENDTDAWLAAFTHLHCSQFARQELIKKGYMRADRYLLTTMLDSYLRICIG